MNPHGILTGLGRQRGKVVRRMVYNSALCVEEGAHAIMRDALADYLLRNAAMAMATSGGGGRNVAMAAIAMVMLTLRGFWQWSNVAMAAGDDLIHARGLGG